MFTPNRCPASRIHRNLPRGAACDCPSKAQAEAIVTPRRAPRGRTTTPAATKKSIDPSQIPPTPPSTSAQPGAGSPASRASDRPATPTPAPRTGFSLADLGGFTPQATQDSTVEQQSGDDFDIGENIDVASRHSAPAYSGEATNTADELSLPDFEMRDNINVAPRHPIVHEGPPSSTSTVLVPETPFVNGRPVPREAENFNHHDPSQRRNSSAAPEPVPDPVPNAIAQHMTDLEIQHLRRSRAQYAHELEESTGLVHRLETQQKIQEADAVLNQAMIGQLAGDRKKAWQMAAEAEEQRQRTKLRFGLTLALLVIIVLAYGCWCIYMSPEMEYIRMRRIQALRE